MLCPIFIFYFLLQTGYCKDVTIGYIFHVATYEKIKTEIYRFEIQMYGKPNIAQSLLKNI
jgi:hypothetical protein